MEDAFYIVRYSYKIQYGFRIMTAAQFGIFLTALLKLQDDEKLEINFHTFEGSEYKLNAVEFVYCFSFQQINKKDCKTIEKAFNIDEDNAWGIFPDVEDILNISLC